MVEEAKAAARTAKAAGAPEAVAAKAAAAALDQPPLIPRRNKLDYGLKGVQVYSTQREREK